MKCSILLALSITLSSCVYLTDEQVAPEETCLTNAIIRDKSHMGGCGFVFELQNGDILEPVQIFRCGTPPLPEEDYLPPIEYKDGKLVRINYQILEQAASACNMGTVVMITCISEMPQPAEDVSF